MVGTPLLFGALTEGSSLKTSKASRAIVHNRRKKRLMNQHNHAEGKGKGFEINT